MTKVVRDISLHLRRIAVPGLGIPTLGTLTPVSSTELDPAKATYWCWQDGNTIALDDRTQIAF